VEAGDAAEARRVKEIIMSNETSAPRTGIELLREQLKAKRDANEATANARGMSEEDQLKREIEIEEKRAEAYSKGLIEEQLLEPEWPGIGRCLARTPSDTVYREFAHKSGMLKGELVNDIAIHEKIAMQCMLVPDGKTFLELARKYNPHAPVQFGGAMLKRMGDKAASEGK
jgi:hypothetical protein